MNKFLVIVFWVALLIFTPALLIFTVTGDTKYYLGIIPLIIGLGLIAKKDWEATRMLLFILLITIGFVWFMYGIVKGQTTKTTASVQQSELRTCIEACGYKFK